MAPPHQPGYRAQRRLEDCSPAAGIHQVDAHCGVVLSGGLDDDDVDAATGQCIGVPVELLGAKAEERMDGALEGSGSKLRGV
jgi:hypothetical protein